MFINDESSNVYLFGSECMERYDPKKKNPECDNGLLKLHI